MNLTLEELKEQLKNLDELTLLEKLEITSEELVETYSDLISERYDTLIEEYEEEDDNTSD